jgi:hypothetical protein
VIDFAQDTDAKKSFHFIRTRSISSTSVNPSVSTVGEWQWSTPVPITSATLFVSDPRAGDRPLPYPKGHHIAICSPNINYVKDLVRKDACPVMVMPVFSFEELMALNDLMPNKFSFEELDVRYHKYGGVPRHVFGSEKYLTNEDLPIKLKFKGLKGDQLLTICEEIELGLLFFDPEYPVSSGLVDRR